MIIVEKSIPSRILNIWIDLDKAGLIKEIIMNQEEVKIFLDKQTWTFAKTYAKKAPHEYIVRGKHTGTDEEFMAVVRYILDNGITMYFWNRPNKYIFIGGRQYWVMRDSEDDPTTIINRCNLGEYKLTITWNEQ